MARCAGITRDGRRCKATAIEASEWCYAHDPTLADERSRHASKGGRTGGRGRISEIPEMKALLSKLTDEVLSGTGETSRYAVANQLVNTRLRAVEVERRLRESEELEKRIEALERQLEDRRTKKWA